MRAKSNLKMILDERNISIRQLADKADLKYETVRRLYHDETMQYQRESIGSICKALDIEIGELLLLTEDTNADGNL